VRENSCHKSMGIICERKQLPQEHMGIICERDQLPQEHMGIICEREQLPQEHMGIICGKRSARLQLSYELCSQKGKYTMCKLYLFIILFILKHFLHAVDAKQTA